MSASDHLSPDQFPRRRFKIQDSPSGFPSWVADIPVDHLTSLADPSRVSDAGSLRHVDKIAGSMRERGFDHSRHNGFDQWGRYSQAQPVHITYHDDQEPQLMNGNHRAWAAQRAGLTHLPGVITDFRKKT